MEPGSELRAIGSLPDGGWVGIRRAPDGYRLWFGWETAAGRSSASRPLLVAGAVAYFEESLAEPPPMLEATQADLAALLAGLATGAGSVAERDLLRRATDAVDDGLPGEAVALILRGALRLLTADEQVDPVDLLVQARDSPT